MKIFTIFSIIFLGYGSTFAQNLQQDNICYNPNSIKDTTKKSIKSMAVGIVGKDTIKIAYHSPGVRGRIIWGGLVPFDDVWVTGAHDATNITVNSPFTIGGKKFPAGKYALFTIPGKTEWTFILNKNWTQHLASEYDESLDLIRMKITPIAVPHVERLQYFIEPVAGKEGKISVAWEKVRIEVPIVLHDQ